jgi:putative protease
MEIVAPESAHINEVDNEFGSITCKNGKYFISFKQLKAQNSKVWDEVHSGNVNPIVLPSALPPYAFFRIPSTEEMNTAPKN